MVAIQGGVPDKSDSRDFQRLASRIRYLGQLDESPSSPVDGHVWVTADPPRLYLRVGGSTYTMDLDTMAPA